MSAPLRALLALTVAVAGGLAGRARADDLAPFPAPTYALGGAVRDVELADVDGDGRDDLLVLRSILGAGQLELWRGLGSGAFLWPVTLASVPNVTWNHGTLLATADLDGDGDLDVVLAPGGASTSLVLLGQGDGSFAAPVPVPTGSQPHAVAIADLDGDGQPDLAIGNHAAGTLSLLHGAGDGSFAPLATLPCGAAPAVIVATDLSGDGLPDLAVANSTAATVSVLAGLGGGAFAPKVAWPCCSSPRALAALDLDGDGLPELVTGCQSFNFAVLDNLGGGLFGPPQFLAPGGLVAVSDLVVADLDDDGLDDLLVGSENGGPRVLLADGAGGLHADSASTYAKPSQWLRVAVGDFGADDRPDVVAGAADGSIATLAGTDAGFAAPQAIPMGALAIALADVTGDGRLDLLSLRQGTRVLDVLPGDGSDVLPVLPHVQTTVASAAEGLRGLEAGDLDGDGLADAVVLVVEPGSDLVRPLQGHADGGFSAWADVPVGDPLSDVRLADLDRDGDLDLLVASGTVRAFAGVGDGSFAVAGTLALPFVPERLATGDLDGDGLADVAVAAQSPATAVATARSTGGGAFAAPSVIALGNAAADVALADIDLDGDADLLFADALGLYTFLSDGQGGFSGSGPLAGPTGPLAVGDFDADGLPDVASTGLSLQVLTGLGDGTWVLPQATYAGGGSASWPGRYVATGDLNGDGDADLVVLDGTAAMAFVSPAHPATPWCDVGQGLAGASGKPTLAGSGPLLAGSPATLALSGAAPSAPATLVVGLSAVELPFKGGVLVPAPDLLLAPLPTGAGGGFSLATTWPAGLPSGLAFWLQAWIPDAGAPHGLAASNALLAVLP